MGEGIGLDPLEAGIEVELRRAGLPGVYRARVEGWNDEVFRISPPVKDGRGVVFDPGEKVQVTIYRQDPPRGKFEATTEVVARGDEAFGWLSLTRPAQWTRHELREFVRIPLILRGQVERESVDGWSKPVPVQILDLSGGGLLLHVPGYQPLRLGVGHRVRITLPLSRETVQVQGQVVRVIPHTDDGGTRYAVEFQNINERDRDRIIGFVLQEEVRQRKRIE